MTAIIEKTIDEFVDAGILFTSVDIANKIKSEGTWVKNRDVSAYLKNAFATNQYITYKVSKISVKRTEDDKLVDAFLYHPINKDPSEYKNTDLKALSPSDVQINDNSTNVPPTKDNTNNSIQVKPDDIIVKKKATRKKKIDTKFSNTNRDYSKFNWI